MKRLFIIHGWEGSPEEGWFPWLKKALEAKGFEVSVPAMPNPEEPEIGAWVSFLKDQVKEIDEETFFVGHSIGCQTILRFLEGETGKVGGVVLVAGWMHLLPEATEEEGAEEVAQPWLETPIDFAKVKEKTDNWVAVFSDNDPYVPQEDAKIFEEKLGAKIIFEKEKGHFSGEDGLTELPVVLDELLHMI